jgi:hypothetical protein
MWGVWALPMPDGRPMHLDPVPLWRSTRLLRRVWRGPKALHCRSDLALYSNKLSFLYMFPVKSVSLLWDKFSAIKLYSFAQNLILSNPSLNLTKGRLIKKTRRKLGQSHAWIASCTQLWFIRKIKKIWSNEASRKKPTLTQTQILIF